MNLINKQTPNSDQSNFPSALTTAFMICPNANQVGAAYATATRTHPDYGKRRLRREIKSAHPDWALSEKVSFKNNKWEAHHKFTPIILTSGLDKSYHNR
jgi:hypothetical protein